MGRRGEGSRGISSLKTQRLVDIATVSVFGSLHVVLLMVALPPPTPRLGLERGECGRAGNEGWVCVCVCVGGE